MKLLPRAYLIVLGAGGVALKTYRLSEILDDLYPHIPVKGSYIKIEEEEYEIEDVMYDFNSRLTIFTARHTGAFTVLHCKQTLGAEIFDEQS